MNVWRVILREIAHRKLNFALGLLSVAAAVGCLVGSLSLLEAHEQRTGEILAAQKSELDKSIEEHQAAVQQAGAELEDSMRRITKGLGFNILILPEDQDLNELHTEGTLSRTMPEEYVTRLANTNIVTVNHLLPMVMQKLEWRERGQTIILTGTRGEVPIMHRKDDKKPLQDAVAPGTMVLGHEVARQQNLKVGDKAPLLGREFTVQTVYEQRGTADDATVWINLAEAQELLGKQNLLNAILALECNCAAKDRIAQIREEIAGILPGTQVIERGPPALARAEARNTAHATAIANLEREKVRAEQTLEKTAADRATLQHQQERFASVLVPVVLVASGVWIGFLMLMNVRERRNEIGILRAIGLRSRQILSIVLGKAVLIGLAGGVVGYFTGAVVAGSTRFSPELFLLAAGLALLLASLASWIPALLAARQDPALVLQEE